jgi:hypothetical protein
MDIRNQSKSAMDGEKIEYDGGSYDRIEADAGSLGKLHERGEMT